MIMDIKIADLIKLEEKEEYPNGANSPTIITKYSCPCGNGEIVEQNTIGFGDHFVSLECKECLKKYHAFIDIMGMWFRLYEK